MILFAQIAAQRSNYFVQYESKLIHKKKKRKKKNHDNKTYIQQKMTKKQGPVRKQVSPSNPKRFERMQCNDIFIDILVHMIHLCVLLKGVCNQIRKT